MSMLPNIFERGPITSALLLSLGLAGSVYGQTSLSLTYLNATSGVGGNTTLADGSVFTPPLNGTTGTDNNWEQRTPFGSGGNIFEAGGEQPAENAPELRTTISGLTPGVSYDIHVNFWDPTSTTEDWSIRAAFTSNAGANTLYSATDAIGELSSTGSVLASTLTYTTAPSIFAESGRALLSGFLGTVQADGSGVISIYIDDRNAATSVNLRTWYDGVSYGVAVVPEPSSFAALAGLVGLGFAATRRRRG
jgi:hypothetical protein